MSGADLIDCETFEASGEDGNENDLDESDEMLLGPVEDRVQPTVARDPGKGPLHRPANSGRQEGAVAAAGNGLDGDTELLAGLGQPFAPVAQVTQCRSPEPFARKFAEHRHDTFGVVSVGRRDCIVKL